MAEQDFVADKDVFSGCHWRWKVVDLKDA
ncbi:uncharacterized protein G2W53_035760 [Senna tora]|uniref:Uncharacterized protein n=1 Tax=Senna tora TaxID=362788 RepID=A0A834W4E4_9FABA|nr:uncharacterized protein G2W53_035760 [Senna tora]